jgi:hypothetical protein
MMFRLSWRRILVGAAFAMILYPLGLIPVVAADTLVGDAEFLRQLLYVSKLQAAEIVAADWLSSLPFAVACWLAMRGLSLGFGATRAMLAGLALALVGIVLALLPPYLPMILATMVLAAAVLGFVFDRRIAQA